MAACTRDFEEARTGVIKLPEDPETVEWLLRHIYGFPLEEPPKARDDRPSHVRKCVHAYIAADKVL